MDDSKSQSTMLMSSTTMNGNFDGFFMDASSSGQNSNNNLGTSKKGAD